MRKIYNESFSPGLKNEGGPVRKLAAAARAVMEPVEHRLMQSVSPATALNQQMSGITAKYETQNMTSSGNSSPGTTVWVNPSDASQSTIIGTDKNGGLSVYDLTGKRIQSISGSFYKVDTRSGFSLGGKDVSIVAADRTDDNSVALFTVNESTRQLTDVTAGAIKLSIGGNVNGVAMYQSTDSGKTFLFVSNNRGSIEQFELIDNGQGEVGAVSVRTINVGSSAEGMTADDESGSLFVAQDGVAIWKYGAEANDGSVRVQIDNSDGYVGSQSESLALYKNSDGSGYLIAARQDTNEFVVYDRESGEYVTKFAVSSGSLGKPDSSDAIAVSSGSFGNGLTGGVFVAHDQEDAGSANFKVVSWNDIANSQSVPLAIDSAQNPTAVSNPVTTATSSVTSAATTVVRTATATAPTVNSLTLINASTRSKLATLTNGSVIDLSDFTGIKLNVSAAVSSNASSVRFGLDGNSKFQLENSAPYELAGSNGGSWAPTVGKHTLTATAYQYDNAGGASSSTYSITFTVVNGTASTASNAQATIAPSTVTGVTATSNSSSQITVKWTGSSTADGYKVERSTDGTNFTQVATVTSTSFTNTGLSNASTYTYRVKAYNEIGTASASSSVKATTAVLTVNIDLPDLPDLSGTRPSATNTGVKSGTVLKSVGSDFTPVSNTTYTNLKITGMVDVKGLKNVKFVNCVIDANGDMYGVRADKGASNITIQNCEIFNAKDAGIYGSGYNAINNYIYKISGDGLKAFGDVLIQGNYITQLGYNAPNSHADGIQIRDGSSNFKITGNYFDMPIKQSNTQSNAALFAQGSFSNLVFDGNWVRGGNYSIHAYDDSQDSTSRISNNIFYSGSSQYGFGHVSSGVAWTGNVNELGKVALESSK